MELFIKGNIPLFEKEEWTDITDLMIQNIQPYYMISNFGNVFSRFSNKILNQFQDLDGYKRVGLCLKDGFGVKSCLVHRLVLLGFKYIPDHEKFQVNHIFGECYDNYYEHLEWCTNIENSRHAFATGLNNCIGEDHYYSSITNQQAKDICELISQKCTSREISEKLCMHYDRHFIYLICAIKQGYAWNHISANYDFRLNPEKFSFHKITDDEVENICRLYEINNKLKVRQILEILGYDINNLSKQDYIRYIHVISAIKRKRHYTSISSKYNF